MSGAVALFNAPGRRVKVDRMFNGARDAGSVVLEYSVYGSGSTKAERFDTVDKAKARLRDIRDTYRLHSSSISGEGTNGAEDESPAKEKQAAEDGGDGLKFVGNPGNRAELLAKAKKNVQTIVAAWKAAGIQVSEAEVMAHVERALAAAKDEDPGDGADDAAGADELRAYLERFGYTRHMTLGSTTAYKGSSGNFVYVSGDGTWRSENPEGKATGKGSGLAEFRTKMMGARS